MRQPRRNHHQPTGDWHSPRSHWTQGCQAVASWCFLANNPPWYVLAYPASNSASAETPRTIPSRPAPSQPRLRFHASTPANGDGRISMPFSLALACPASPCFLVFIITTGRHASALKRTEGSTHPLSVQRPVRLLLLPRTPLLPRTYPRSPGPHADKRASETAPPRHQARPKKHNRTWRSRRKTPRRTRSTSVSSACRRAVH